MKMMLNSILWIFAFITDDKTTKKHTEKRHKNAAFRYGYKLKHNSYIISTIKLKKINNLECYIN